MSSSFVVGHAMVTEPVRQLLGARSRRDIARHVGLSPQAVYDWDVKGKLPPLQAIRLHKDHGVPMEKLYPLIEGL